MSDTIIARLEAQRTLLVDVLRQVDAAITNFGGAPNGNGNGNADTKNGVKLHWTKTASRARLSRIAKKAYRARRKNANQTESVTYPVPAGASF